MDHTPLPRVTSLHPPRYDPLLPQWAKPTLPGRTVTPTSTAIDVETLTLTKRMASEGSQLSFTPHIRMDDLFNLTSSSSLTPRYTYQILQAPTRRASVPHTLERSDIRNVPFYQLTRLQLRNVSMTMDDCLEMIWRCGRLESLCLSGVIYAAAAPANSMLPNTRICTVQTGIRDLTIADRCDIDCKPLFTDLIAENLYILSLSLPKENLEKLAGDIFREVLLKSAQNLQELILPAADVTLAEKIRAVIKADSPDGLPEVLLLNEGRKSRVN